MATKASVQIEAEDKFSATVRAAKAQFSGLQDSIGRVTAVTGSLNGAFAGLAATFVAGGFIGGVKSLVGSIDDLDEAAQGLGTTAVALSELQLAAKESGVGSEQLGQALTKLNVKITDAAGGSKEAMATFKAMGIAIRDANGNVRSTDDVLKDVANAFSGYKDGAEKSALAVDLFGRSGQRLVAYLNQGGDALRKNSGLTEDAVQQAIKLQREFDTLAANAQRASNALAGPLAKALNSVFAAFRLTPEQELVKLNYQIEQLRNNMARTAAPGSSVFNDMAEQLTELEIRAAKLRTELNKSGQDRFISNSSALRRFENQTAAPVLDKGDKPKKEKEEIDDSTRALAAFVDQLERERDVTEELTRVEQALKLLKERPDIDTPQVRELLLLEAQKIDNLKAEKKMNEDIAAINKKNLEEEIQAHKQLNDQIMELSGVTGENRKIALTAELDKIITQSKELEAQGLPPILNAEQIENAVKGIAGIKDELAKTSDTAQQFAMTFSSALEDVIVKGGNVSDMLQGLLQDILRIATRTLITTPLTNFLGGFFSGLGGLGGFGGGGGGAGASVPGLGSGDLLGGSLGLASNRRGGSGVTVVYNIAQVGSNVSRADMLSAMQQTRAATIGDLQDMSARGRLKLA